MFFESKKEKLTKKLARQDELVALSSAVGALLVSLQDDPARVYTYQEVLYIMLEFQLVAEKMRELGLYEYNYCGLTLFELCPITNILQIVTVKQ